MKWYAAFHNESGHPHVHLVSYSTGKEPYMTRQGLEKLKAAYAHEIFKNDLYEIYEKQTEYRDELRTESKEKIAEIIREINGKKYENETIELMMKTLAEKLQKPKGKKVYGYLPKDVKNLVNGVIDELVRDSDLQKLYELWYEQRENVLKTYRDKMPARLPLSANEEFKSVRNAVIAEAMNLLFSSTPVIDEKPAEPTDKEIEKSEKKSRKDYKTAWQFYDWAKACMDKNGEEYDRYWDYPKLLTDLILPALHEHGLTNDMPVWEDICSYPDRFVKIYEQQLNLPKIQNLDWSRAQEKLNSGRVNDWYLVGSHDNIPAMTYMQRIGDMKDGSKGEYTREHDAWNTGYLAGYLNMDDDRDNIQNIRKELIDLYNSNDRERIRAKFAELMTTPKFQISFADLLGITDVTYNIGGSKRKENWEERISADYLDKYYENLSSENPTALNIPELLKKALQAKIDMQVMQSNDKNKTRAELNEKYKPLLADLQKYADILKEPENE